MIRFTTATDPGCCISVQPRKDAHWRDQESAALPNGIALAPARGKGTAEEGPGAGGCPMADRIIQNAESADYPVWFVVSGEARPVLYAGPFFSRASAEKHLAGYARVYPKGAHVYCASGHMSDDYRHLCETGRLREASNG